MADHITTYLQIHVPDFLSAPWHSTITSAFDKIDAILYGLAQVSKAPAWANSTVYVLGNMRQDMTTGIMYMCLVGHTSAAGPTTFATDRINHPTYWQAVV